MENKTIINPYRKIVIISLLGISLFLLGNAWTLLPVISNTLMTNSKWNLTNLNYTFLTFSLLIGALISAPISSSFSHKYGAKFSILGGIILAAFSMGIFTLGYFQHADQIIYYLLPSQFILGICISALLGSISTYTTQVLKNQTTIFLPILYACINLGSFANPNIINFFHLTKNWVLASFCLFCFFLIILVFISFIFPNVIQSQPENKKKVLSALATLPKFFWIFFFIIIIYAVNEIAMTSWGVILLHQLKHISIAHVNFALSLYWITVAVSQILFGITTSYISPKLIFSTLPLFLLIAWIGLLISNQLNWIFLFFIISGLGNSAFFSLTVVFAEKASDNLLALASGIIVKGYFIGSIIGTTIIGLLRTHALASFEYIIMLLCFQSLALFFLVAFSMLRISLKNKAYLLHQ